MCASQKMRSTYSLIAPRGGLALLISVGWFGLSCQKSLDSSQNHVRAYDGTDPWVKQAWLDKTARALRFGEGMGSMDVPLLAKGREEVVDSMMADRRFVETVLDFNLYFLNFKPNELFKRSYNGRVGKVYDDVVFGMPQALTAARAVATNGDYFLLFDSDQPFYLENFRKFFGNVPAVNGVKLSDRESRLKVLSEVLDLHEKIIGIFNSAAESDLEEAHSSSLEIKENICSRYREAYDSVTNLIGDADLPAQIESALYKIYNNAYSSCFLFSEELDLKEISLTLFDGKSDFLRVIEFIKTMGDDSEKITSSPLDIKIADPKYFPSSQQAFTSNFWTTLPNSSTNFNRRRAAYVLKTYFCDDLTPLNIAQPETHSGNKHADDAACAACHYKLDPMAGFFRYQGVGGSSFENKKTFIFDDLVTIKGTKLAEYWDTWRHGSTGTWNVGYIRSPLQPSLNSYGESLKDLSKIFRESKEVRQCLTQRMAEYFLGKDQIYDGEWLNSLASNFETAAASNKPGATSLAFKAVVKELVLSNTFVVPDPEPHRCYDFAPGQGESSLPSLPCEIAFIIKKNCATCHGDQAPSGSLNLTQWLPVTRGVFSFDHLDEDGKPVSKSETFKRLAERLSTSDESMQMPLNMQMDSVERAQLYKWVLKEAENSQGEK